MLGFQADGEQFGEYYPPCALISITVSALGFLDPLTLAPAPLLMDPLIPLS